ncbi:MAG: DUF819 family protein [Candidatus Izemoplasmatales bacterium]
MIYSLVQLVFIFLVPILIIRGSKFRLTRIFGTIGTAYLAGIAVALVVFALRKLGVDIVVDAAIGEIGSHAAIGVGIPLLLFSSNLLEARKLSKTVLLSFASLLVSALLVATVAFYAIGRTMANGAVLAAMSVGVYTGGTPNLNAIANIFGLDATALGLANLSDMIVGAVFYVFLLVAAKPLVAKILKPSRLASYMNSPAAMKNTEEIDLKRFRPTRRLFLVILVAFSMTAVSAGAGILVWVLLGAVQGRMTDYVVPAMMLGVTVLGILGSFNRKIRRTEGTNVVGHYLILVFSFALASSLDLTKVSTGFGMNILFYGVITVGIFAVHVLFSKLLGIDADCAIVTATAGLYGPAFIPAVTKQLQNDALTVPGLVCGSIGYAAGTFLGVLMGLLFMV